MWEKVVATIVMAVATEAMKQWINEGQ